jgi:hypothetical protein
MTASLSWLDHDPAERERTNRVLALFSARESRDELGLGAIRDSISDSLFPGTSTIQTRLRYFLFIPWMYSELEQKRVGSDRIASTAREYELSLVAPLTQDDYEYGIFGRTSRGQLKRLPSSVYWNGMRTWGILKFLGSQSEYHSYLDLLYRRIRTSTIEIGDDPVTDSQTITWHRQMPYPPDGFPAALDLRVTSEEADFLRDCLARNCRNTLLQLLARDGISDTDFPWEQQDPARFGPDNALLLKHGAIFSSVMHGASLLYNLLLAEMKDHEEWQEKYRKALQEWAGLLYESSLENWDLNEFWIVANNPGHKVTLHAHEFVRSWLECVSRSRSNLFEASGPLISGAGRPIQSRCPFVGEL